MENQIKILLVGDAKVGKTKLACAIHKRSYEEHLAKHDVNCISSKYKYHDSAYSIHTCEMDIKQGTLISNDFDCVFLCVNWNEKKSIEKLLKIKDALAQKMNKKPLFFLMCCKIDVLFSLSPNECRNLLKDLKSNLSKVTLPVFLTSAQTDFNIKETINILIDHIINKIPIPVTLDQMINDFQKSEGIPNF